MNKTLLIVICDFLLLSMLGLISFDDLPTKQDANDDALAAPYVDSQLVDLLKISLDKERENRENLSSKIDEYSSKTKEIEDISKAQAQELSIKQELLAKTEQEKLEALAILEQEKAAKAALEQENIKALESARDLEAKLAEESEHKKVLELDAVLTANTLMNASVENEILAKQVEKMSESDAYLKARLDAMQAELELTKQQATSLMKEKEEIQYLSQELNTKLEVATTKAELYEQDLKRSQALIAQEKTEKQQIQEHAQTLATGVDKLVDTQEKLAQKVEEIRPLSASEIYETFKANSLNIDFNYKRSSILGEENTTDTYKSVVVDIEGEYWAFLSVAGTVFDRAKNKFFAPDDLQISPWAKGFKIKLSALYFLNNNSQILALKVPKAFIEQSNLKLYKISENPFKFSEATLIDSKKLYYGQLKYSVDGQYSSLAKVDSTLFSAILGDFSPSAGDLAFSRSGNFLGLMANASRLFLLRSFSFSKPLMLLDNYSKEQAKGFFLDLNSKK